MELTIKAPEVKRISFADYQKYFLNLLKSPDPPYHILFYKKTSDGIEVSFSWDGFIIIVEVSYSEIKELYADAAMNTADVTLSDKEDHPVLLKFYTDYLFGRGIPEL
jgi:hypothetical protein